MQTKEEKKAYNAAYRAAHLEESKAYREAHKEEKKAYGAAQKAANPEKLRAASNAWKAANPERRRATSRAWKAANREKRKARDRWTLYGLSPGAFQLMLLMQRNACGICGELLSKSPHVDHNHETGEVRGLLCHRCNKGLGFFRDSLEILELAKKYLQG